MEHDIVTCDEMIEDGLKRFFGYNTFRPLQKEIIQALLKHEDVLAILPTGAGKSLCYQLPALLLPGTAIVVSPLISLMQDQVVSLYKNGISAAFINSSLPPNEIRNVIENLCEYKLIYVAPERLLDPDFLERLKSIPLSFFVIDEAHCISQWGHSFRSEYRRLSLLKQFFPNCPVIALTATATFDVEKDIQIQLAMPHPTVIKGSFDRPNLLVRAYPKCLPEKQLMAFIESQGHRPGIIYAATRKNVDATYNQLAHAGFAVGRYHAGMTEPERSASQHAFLHDRISIMVATVAFGMGVHKPDIRFIVHLDMPRTIEQYYQEIGRAGRDGLPAECLMLYGFQDLIIYKSFLEQIEDSVVRHQSKAKMESMYKLCTSLMCRRRELLGYFGEDYTKEDCGGCDNCLDKDGQTDERVTAQKILSCVYRLKQNVGIKMLTDVLRGSKSQPLIKRGYDQISTYGLLKELSEQEVRYCIDAMLHHGLLKQTEGDYPVLKWTELSQAAVNGQEPFFIKKRFFKEAKTEKQPLANNESLKLHYDENFFQVLRQLRLEIARQEAIPPYVVFSDRALQEMAVYFPLTKDEFVKINGVGPVKWMKYGEKFLEVIRLHRGERPMPIREGVLSPYQRKDSREKTLSLYKQGRNIEEIMDDRQLAKSTIIAHLSEAIQQGAQLDLKPIISEARQEAIKQVIAEVGPARLAPIKEKLPPDFSYDEIRLVAALFNVGED